MATLKSILKSFYFYFKKMKLKSKNVRFFNNVVISKNCFFEGYNSIGAFNNLVDCYFGAGSYTGKNVQLSYVKVGKFCSIGSFVRNTTGRHPSSVFVSTHPAFYSKTKAAGFTFAKKQKFEELKFIEDRFLVTIGNDVWIGDNVTILDGIKIGDGAIIGTNSLVTKDIEPYTINIGSPSKFVKYRFDDDEIRLLLKSKWWEKDMKWLEDNYDDFDDITKFANFFKCYSKNDI